MTPLAIQAAIACFRSGWVSVTAPLSHPPLTISALTRAADEKNVSDPATGRELTLIVQAFGYGRSVAVRDLPHQMPFAGR
jgi:hypothetical protein